MMGPVVCPHCEARYDRSTWLTLPLLDRCDLVEAGWIELRRCEACEQAVAAPADGGANDDLLPTDAAARYCGVSVSGLRRAARRGEIRPWTSSAFTLLWRCSDLDRFLEARRGPLAS